MGFQELELLPISIVPASAPGDLDVRILALTIDRDCAACASPALMACPPVFTRQ